MRLRVYDPPTVTRYLRASGEAPKVYSFRTRTYRRWANRGVADPRLTDVSGRDLLFGFEDLVSVRAVAILRTMNVKWRAIYEAEKYLRRMLDSPYPFAHKELWTNTVDILTRVDDLLVAASQSGQIAIPKLVNPSLESVPDLLQRFELAPGLTFDPVRKIATMWAPHTSVLLDPRIQFGDPCIAGTRIPTNTISGLVKAGDPPSLVASMYQITRQQLDDALEWETRVAA